MICGDKNYSLEQPNTCPACGYPQGKALCLVLCINYNIKFVEESISVKQLCYNSLLN